jgi:micrococcal nuclease
VANQRQTAVNQVKRVFQLMTKVLLAISFCALFTVSANAATLYGNVIEINDGDTVTIVNLNRPLKVQILGVLAPEEEQAYADVAKRHLSDLILHKTVVVDYSGLVQNSYIQGKVYYKDIDVGVQMLRDGVAWFDQSAKSRLTESEKEVYAGSELAARSERRGLWQDSNAVPPWEFKQQQAARQAASQSAPSLRTVEKETANNALRSEDLLRGFGTSLSSSKTAPGDGQWRTFAPEGKHFSLQVPGAGSETSSSVPAGAGMANLTYWLAEFEGATYVVAWSEGPNLNYTDAAAIDAMAKGFVTGLNHSLEQRGLDLQFDSKRQASLKLDGYNGSQFDVSATRITGVVRAFSKQFGEQREMYLVGVLNATDKNESVQKFLNSLSLQKKE